MKKGLRARDYILIGLEIIDDVLQEFHNPGGLVSASYKNMYGFVPKNYKKRSFDNLLNRLEREGYINRKIEKGSKYYSITEKGKILARKKRVLFNNKKWDGKIWILIFDVKETQRKKRDHLREIIRIFGFSMWQESVWISAFKPSDDFYEYCEDEDLKDDIFIFPVDRLIIENLKSFARKVWNLDKLELLYIDWINKASFYIKGNTEKKEGREDLIKRFFKIIMEDPFLPEEFLPYNWVGDEAKKILKELNASSK